MRRILFGLAAGVLGVVGLAGGADAREVHGHGHAGHHPAYYREHGHRFSGGYYYSRHEHPVWGRRAWDDHYRRWQYWDPYLQVWYYWSPQGQCYYPITYCP
ncbi:MAG TPA: hypothetical protein VFW33_00850 [Gemmataceae bacterium]|nr:hypothetical protein [Gemmataceae bacterium]